MAIINAPRKKQKKHGKQKKRVSVSAQKAKNNGRAQPKPKVKSLKKAKKGDVVNTNTIPTIDKDAKDVLDELDIDRYTQDALLEEDEFFGDLPEDDFLDEPESVVDEYETH